MAKQAATPKPQQNKPNPFRPNFWGMLERVLLAIVNRGQLLALGACVIIIIIMSRMPPEDLSKITFEIMHHFKIMYVGGWILSIVLVVLFFIGYRRLRKLQGEELNRMAALNSELQEKLLKIKPH